MTDPVLMAERILTRSGYNLLRLSGTETPCLAFENETIFGFMHFYAVPDDLLARWSNDYETAIRRFSFALRRAEQKAWNAYAVFLASDEADRKSARALHAIEENLSATRKIARAGTHNSENMKAALLPLLPIQNAPHFEPIDINSEIRGRAQDVPKPALDAFFDGLAEEDVLREMEDSR